MQVIHKLSDRKWILFSTLLCLLLQANVSLAQDAKKLFGEYNNRIYQIRIIELASGKQASIGSGFQITEDGLVISNFHVVADYVHHPERYRIVYANHQGENGDVTLINIDVVNDLSLLKITQTSTDYIQLASSLPAHGDPIYSLGNPHDLGLTVVPGTFNGITTYSAYEHIHISAAINAGMSGGPTLNAAGEIIGVNVASSGNQVGFLIPLHRLRSFVLSSADVPIDSAAHQALMGQQLVQHQQQNIGNLLAQDWNIRAFGEANIPNEIASFIRCWGFTEDDPEIKYTHATSYCREEEKIYISSQFNTGVILYRFDWFETSQLNSIQFYNVLKSKISNATADNVANKENVTDYKCHDGFIKTSASQLSPVTTKAAYCARSYKKYPGLYDVLYLGITVDQDHKALLSYFTLSGVSQEMSTQFTKKFISSISWN